MSDFLQFLLELVRSVGLDESNLHRAELVIVFSGLLFSMGIMSGIGLFFSWRQFRKRSFFDQVVIGVNILEKSEGRYQLKLRTLVETNLDSLLDNPILQRMVEKAAKKCTVGNPILKLPDDADHALFLTKIQNAISACFGKEHVLHMLGMPCKSVWVEFVATCERYGGIKTTKIRVLVFVRHQIERLLEKEYYEKIAVEDPNHQDRLRTLRLITINHLADKDAVRGKVEIPCALN